ncbi:hypothetical protein BDV95DRAFT_454996, partial [Massariosphaeria phaeospora]
TAPMVLGQPEALIWCVVSWTVVVLRLISRRMRLGGWRRLQLEDAVAVLAVLSASALMVVLDGVQTYWPAPGPLTSYKWTPQFVRNRTLGQKLRITTEELLLVSVWTTKAGLLLMYHQLTELTNQRKQVLFTAVYVAVSFVVLELALTVGWCRPFSEYWAMIPENKECRVYTNYYIMLIAFNVSTDLLILIIPLPLLRSRKVGIRRSWRTKLIILAILALGVFTITCSVVSKIFFLQKLRSLETLSWYTREAFTAILCANLSRCMPV